MQEYLTEFKLTFLAIIGYTITWTDFDQYLQRAILIVSLCTALIALFRTIKHKQKKHEN